MTLCFIAALTLVNLQPAFVAVNVSTDFIDPHGKTQNGRKSWLEVESESQLFPVQARVIIYRKRWIPILALH